MNITEPQPGVGSSSGFGWFVACVLIQPGRMGVTRMLLRQGIWYALDQDAAIHAAVDEARSANPGWRIQMTGATPVPPQNATSSATPEDKR